MVSQNDVSYDNTTRHHKSEDHDLNLHRRENLKSRVRLTYEWTLVTGSC